MLHGHPQAGREHPGRGGEDHGVAVGDGLLDHLLRIAGQSVVVCGGNDLLREDPLGVETPQLVCEGPAGGIRRLVVDKRGFQFPWGPAGEHHGQKTSPFFLFRDQTESDGTFLLLEYDLLPCLFHGLLHFCFAD